MKNWAVNTRGAYFHKHPVILREQFTMFCDLNKPTDWFLEKKSLALLSHDFRKIYSWSQDKAALSAVEGNVNLQNVKTCWLCAGDCYSLWSWWRKKRILHKLLKVMDNTVQPYTKYGLNNELHYSKFRARSAYLPVPLQSDCVYNDEWWLIFVYSVKQQCPFSDKWSFKFSFQCICLLSLSPTVPYYSFFKKSFVFFRSHLDRIVLKRTRSYEIHLSAELQN